MPRVVLARGTDLYGPKNFAAPKRADLRGWWNAARKALKGNDGFDIGLYPGWAADRVDREAIVWNRERWTLSIWRRP